MWSYSEVGGRLIGIALTGLGKASEHLYEVWQGHGPGNQIQRVRLLSLHRTWVIVLNTVGLKSWCYTNTVAFVTRLAFGSIDSHLLLQHQEH